MPRSPYIPNPADQSRVHELAAIGLSDEDIAAQLGLRPRKFQRHFRLELKRGAADGREHALRKLYHLATSGENLNALIFYVKSRCGWRDTGPAPSQAPTIKRSVIVFKPRERSSDHENC